MPDTTALLPESAAEYRHDGDGFAFAYDILDDGGPGPGIRSASYIAIDQLEVTDRPLLAYAHGETVAALPVDDLIDWVTQYYGPGGDGDLTVSGHLCGIEGRR